MKLNAVALAVGVLTGKIPVSVAVPNCPMSLQTYYRSSKPTPSIDTKVVYKTTSGVEIQPGIPQVR